MYLYYQIQRIYDIVYEFRRVYVMRIFFTMLLEFHLLIALNSIFSKNIFASFDSTPSYKWSGTEMGHISMLTAVNARIFFFWMELIKKRMLTTRKPCSMYQNRGMSNQMFILTKHSIDKMLALRGDMHVVNNSSIICCLTSSMICKTVH